MFCSCINVIHYQSLQFLWGEDLVVLSDEGGASSEWGEGRMLLDFLGVGEGGSEWVVKLVGVPADVVVAD